MKGFSLITYDYKWKKYAIAASIAGLMLMLAERLKGFIVFPKLSVVQHYQVFEWVMLGGLYTLIYCREKDDDERVKTVRLKSFAMAFTVTISVMLAITLTTVTIADKAPSSPLDLLFLLGGLGIIFYLLMFNIGLHFDSLWEYGDVGLFENLRSIPRNKWSILLYLFVSGLLLVFLFFINKPQ